MAQEKFSEFTSKTFTQIKDPLINTTINLVGVDETNDDNIKINFLEFLASGNNLGSGSSVFKNITDLKQFNFRKLKAGSNKVTVTENVNDISIDIDASNINISDLDGYVPPENGGLGDIGYADIEDDAIVFWDKVEEKYDFAGIGEGLEISTGKLKVISTNPTTVKGDILTRSATEEIRLPVGTDGQVLISDSNEASGLKWSTIATENIGKLQVDSNATPSYIGTIANEGVIRTNSTLNKIDGGDYITLGVNPNQIDANQLNNDNANLIKNYSLENNLDVNSFALSHTATEAGAASGVGYTGLKFLPTNQMHYYNNVPEVSQESFDLKISRNSQGGDGSDFGARILLEKATNFIASNDVLGEIWFSSNDTYGSDGLEGSIGILARASGNHDSFNRGGYLEIKGRSATDSPNTEGDVLITINKNSTKETEFAGPIKTSGTSITAQEWELGSASAGTVGGTATAIEVEIDGTVYYLTAGTSVS